MKYKIVSYKPLMIFVASIVTIVAIIFGWRWYQKNARENPSLSQAAKMGEMTTHKLMVQIENKNCPPEMASGCYERGDIVLIKEGGWEFSDAEKEGFLILHMDLTDKQAEIMVQALEKKGKTPSVPDGTSPPSKGEEDKPKDMPPMMETLKMRKYTVNFEKIGIGPDDQKGREITDKVFKWNVVSEKD